jgi:hypothetical protein
MANMLHILVTRVNAKIRPSTMQSRNAASRAAARSGEGVTGDVLAIAGRYARGLFLVAVCGRLVD